MANYSDIFPVSTVGGQPIDGLSYCFNQITPPLVLDYDTYALTPSVTLSFPADFTVELIFKFDELLVSTKSNTNGIISADNLNGYPSTGWGLFHRYTAAQKTLIFEPIVIGEVSFNTELITGQFYHVAVSRLGDILKGFIDGVEKFSTTCVDTVPSSSSIRLSGTMTSDADRRMKGVIKAVRICTSALYSQDFAPPSLLSPLVV
jgi:hypothetical protein